MSIKKLQIFVSQKELNNSAPTHTPSQPLLPHLFMNIEHKSVVEGHAIAVASEYYEQSVVYEAGVAVA